ncbi:Shootin-1 [Heterocephalus glaber]|uniref:Shootin-1 n=1 Tax=Heterocephalus glaber TaxID=10181 RepID=G5AS34_HETGA|nr:Shootin-1 [Heterocephalus glaber]
MVTEEVSFMQNHLEIEKICQENAKALATKLNKENKTLKRISMLSMAKLGPDVITEEISIDDEDATTDIDGAAETCISVQCQKQINELQDQISTVPDQQLLKALDENAKLIQQLEEERIQHQQKVKELEKQLENEALHKEIHNLKQQLELLEENKKELELKYQNSEEKARNLKHSIDELQKRVNQSKNSVLPPPPPPPPLPPPPPNPIRSLISMIWKRSHPSGSGAKKEKAIQPETTEEVTDLEASC